MALDWFGRARRGSIADLIARKNYKKAIEAIRGELTRRRKDRRLRLQLAEVLVLAGRKKEAIEALTALADDLALAGFAAQSIAVLKKILSIEPTRSEVEEKLVYLIDQQSRPAEDPWAIARRRRELEPSGFEIGMEEIGDEAAAVGSDIGMEGPPEGDVEIASGIGADPLPIEPAAPLPTSEALLSDDAVRDELVGLLEETLVAAPGPSDSDLPPAHPLPRGEVLLRSPLFSDFSRDELTAVIRGLSLRSFEPGEIVITEGEPRGSLFVIAAGKVRAYVRHASGRSLAIRDLGEGDFFGEISILTGRPRSATLTAATHCELLELDRANLDNICRSHPRVRQVLQEFHNRRANNTIEAAIRQMEIENSSSEPPPDAA